MRDVVSADVIAWVERSIGRGAQRVSLTRAEGATSSSVYFIKATGGGPPLDCVLRLFTNERWLEEEPDLPEHEAAVLTKTCGAGLPAPKLIAYASDDSECGVPAVLMSFIDGRIVLRPDDFESWLTRMSQALAEIHSVSTTDLRWEYFSWTDKDGLEPPVWSKHPELWERAIEMGLGGPPDHERVFIHRDYHPTNVLWASQKLSGVVDWVNACRGPASVDLAHCRGNLVSMFGPAIAERFLQAYKRVVGPGFVHHPYWDIDALLGTLPEPGWYPPWEAFGLERIDQGVLRARKDNYLGTIMSRM